MNSLILASSTLLLLLTVSDSWEEQAALLQVVEHAPWPSEDHRPPMQKVAACGEYSLAGPVAEAEGALLQVHPLGLCEPLDQDELYEYGWIALVKVESPDLVFEPPICGSLLNKAKRALQRGAVAIIFIVHENLDAAKQLDKTPAITRLSKPIILVKEKVEASKLLNITAASQHFGRMRIATKRATLGSEEEESRRDDIRQASPEVLHRIVNAILLVASLSVVCTFAAFALYLRRTHGHTERVFSSLIMRHNIHASDNSFAVKSVLEHAKKGSHKYCSECTVEFEESSIGSWNENKLNDGSAHV